MLEILILVLISIVLLLFVYIWLLRKEISNMIKQIEIISNEETNALMNFDFVDERLIKLIIAFNKYIKKKVESENKNHLSKEVLKKTVLNMSHDVRTPLTSIQGYLQLLEMEEIDENEKVKYLMIIKERIELLRSMLENFFELEKLESDNIPINLKSLDLYTLITEAIVLYYDDFKKKNLEVSIQLDKDMFALLDESVMKRVVHNIIGNVVKHGVNTLEIRSEVSNCQLRIMISNETVDVNEENVKSLFDKFYTVSTSRVERNTGLGLAIAKEFVERMQGTINASYSKVKLTIEMVFNRSNLI